MAISIVLDACALPAKGPVDLDVKRQFTINISAEEAQHQVHQWLVGEISGNIGADYPTLVIGATGEQPVWRVPAALASPRFGRVGVVGVVEVAVETGAILNRLSSKLAIEQAADQLAQRLPTYLPRATTPAQFLPQHVQPAHKLVLAVDEFTPNVHDQEALLIEIDPV